ncbi:conserved Plasmodium protein, unknown function [Plasmodium gallinaceum]|uniref:Uncharacterized protein n=1 Tax=Plasmodium gallinaceum TaxID=5849 RepID=A0A1J1H0B3_PLAGA|nr:conserved Plasmodium protein, unknown function [Plasmodium gallinaceum]CRG98003.1 conserved Plasmodium protein, unknown function [Plasmodium gallinaceum]
MLIFKRHFSRFINNNSKKTARKNFHKNLTQYKNTTNNVTNQNENNKLSRGGGLLNTFYESFIYGCGFFLSNRLLDQIFGPRHYDTYNSNTDNYVDENQNNYMDQSQSNYSNENFLNNDSTIDDDDFKQDIGLDDDTFEI